MVGSDGKAAPIFDGSTSQYFIYQVVYAQSSLIMTVINRKDLRTIYNSTGFIDYDILEPGELAEIMFWTFAAANDPSNKYYLSRVTFKIDPYSNELLEKTESLVGLGDNCGSKIIATTYLVFVSCPS